MKFWAFLRYPWVPYVYPMVCALLKRKFIIHQVACCFLHLPSFRGLVWWRGNGMKHWLNMARNMARNMAQLWAVQGITTIRGWACPSVCSRLWPLDFQRPASCAPVAMNFCEQSADYFDIIVWIYSHSHCARLLYSFIFHHFSIFKQWASGSAWLGLAATLSCLGILGLHHPPTSSPQGVHSWLRIQSLKPRFSAFVVHLMSSRFRTICTYLHWFYFSYSYQSFGILVVDIQK